MQIIADPAAMHELCASWRCQNSRLGFVPTMGALHAGHLELCRRARSENERFVASVFVNPTQFGLNEDLSDYPRPFERDCERLREAGCDAVFTPTPQAMFDDRDFLHGTWIDVAPFDDLWEGVTRPGHLRGVATVVAKLFNITHPSHAYFGEKDLQQLRVVEALVRDLKFPTQIVPVPTVRESDGLAMSSRNAFLSSEERRAATALFRAMQQGAELVQNGERDVKILGEAMQAILDAESLVQTQYLSVVNDQTLAPLRELDGTPARIIVAAFVGQTRLIDNLLLPETR